MSVAGDSKVEITSEKQKLFLAALALSPDLRRSRTELISLLWGSHGAEQARGSLRHTLWALRKVLGDQSDEVLQIQGQIIGIRRATVDVVGFESSIAEGSISSLEHAMSLYRGELLEDFDLGGQQGLEPLLFERERLLDLAVTTAKRLADLHVSHGNESRAAATAHRALAIDPLQEDVHRLLMRIYRDGGQTGLAMKQYQTCKDVLAELGVVPSAETEKLKLSMGVRARFSGAGHIQQQNDALTNSPSRTPLEGRRLWSRIVPVAIAVAAIVPLSGYLIEGAFGTRTPKPHIAVLPFEDVSIDQQQAIYSTGLTTDIITDLAKLSGVEVIARDSVRAIQWSDASILEIADILNVDFVLRGNVRRSRGQVRVNAQLIDADTGTHVWAERFDRDTDDLFEVQDEIVRQVVAALAVDVSDTEEDEVARIPTRNLEAYDHFLRAEHLALDSAGTDNRRRKLDAYQLAIDLDPDFAEAYAGYARSLVDIWRFDMTDLMSGTVAKKEAYRFANEALTRNTRSARALTALALIQLSDGQHGAAAASARNAAEIQPGNADVQADLALVLALTGQPDDAQKALTLAHSLNPAMPPDLLITSGIVAFEAERYEDAAQYLEQALEKHPSREWANVIALAAYGQMGDRPSSVRTFDRLLEAFPIANLNYYRAAQDQMRTPLQSKRFVEGLKRAGVPEWPYGVETTGNARVSNASLERVAFDSTWVGVHHSGTPFIQENGSTGRFAYRSEMSLRTGLVSVEDDRMCETSDGNIPSGKSCGNLFATNVMDADYMLLMPESVRYFSIAK